jgi:TonB family protein
MNSLLFSVAVFIVSPVPGVTQAQGAWKYDSTKDEMTDEVRFLISTNARPFYGDRGDLIIGMIGWRCSATNGREVLMVMDKYFGGNSYNQVLVETRFDSARSDTGWWNLSANKQGAFMPTEDISAFTNRVGRGRRLLVRVTDPLDGEAITYSFDLVGFTTVYRRLEPNCPKDQGQVASAESPRDVEGDSARVMEQLASDQVFMESVVEERPVIISGPQLNYPDLLRHAGVQGRVLVQAIIDTSGRAEPQSVKIIQSPNPGLDQPAKNYVLRALFRPARVHGRAVRVLLNLPIDFKIKR